MAGSRVALRHVLACPVEFAEHVVGTRLRAYQAEPLRAIGRAISSGDGGAFALMFSRQAGKNHISAHLEAWALARFSATPGAQIVKTAPTLRPQLVNSVMRLERVLRNRLTAGRWRRDGSSIVLGRARVMFLSGAPGANVVGATASVALEFDEAQDIELDKHDRDFMPMAATTNAVRVYYGTAWTDATLLARTLAELRGTGRAFVVPWARVAEEVPAYGRFVESERVRLGADHPMFRTQYELEMIAGAGRLLNARQLAQLRGTHVRALAPGDLGGPFVAGVDVAGEGEVTTGRDATVVTIARVSLVEVVPGIPEPMIEVVDHLELVGVDQRAQYGQIVSVLRDVWGVTRVCVDATGLGAGLASFLGGALGASVVEAVAFTGPSKSAMGYAMLSAINAGRLKMYVEVGQSAEGRECWRELEACRYEMAAGALMRWSVPDLEGHDDYVASLALAVRAAGDSAIEPAATTLARPVYGARQRW